MKTIEIRKRIPESKKPEWFNSVTAHFYYPQLNVSNELIGLSSIHSWLSAQIHGWEKLEPIPKEFESSKIHFKKLLDRIEQFINENLNQESTALLSSFWERQINPIINENYHFTFDCPESDFLMGIYQSRSISFKGAYEFITGGYKINSKDDFIGALLAYEFESKAFTELPNRRDKEKASISQLRNQFNERLNDSEIQLTEHLINSKKAYDEYISKIDLFQKSKEDLFSDWFNSSTDLFDKWNKQSKSTVRDLEKTYEELLRLKKPAEYWSVRAGILKKEGWKAIYWLIGLVSFACVSLYLLLWLTPEGMLLSFVKGEAQAIKWSIVYITFISFLAYGIRALNKVAFSSFHLSRDSEEREQLTYVYLSLIKDNAVDEKDKNLIMQSLFSRAETGLLKDDSGPVMPNDITGRIYGK